MVERISTFRPAVGVDPSTTMVTEATRHARPVVVATGDALPFPARSISTCLVERVLQHVTNVEAVVADLLRVTIPGGVIVTVDSVHVDVELNANINPDLLARVMNWRAHSGVMCPEAAATTVELLRGSGCVVNVHTFWCNTNEFDAAQVLTNFPEWARLGVNGGAPLTAADVTEWEMYWQGAQQGTESFTFRWPVQVNVAYTPA